MHQEHWKRAANWGKKAELLIAPRPRIGNHC
ncbi:hypothetical protein M3J09_012476 [Ascochyta lentis]